MAVSLAPAPELVVQPLVEVCRHVLHIAQVSRRQQLQLLKHVSLTQLGQLRQHLQPQVATAGTQRSSKQAAAGAAGREDACMVGGTKASTKVSARSWSVAGRSPPA